MQSSQATLTDRKTDDLGRRTNETSVDRRCCLSRASLAKASYLRDYERRSRIISNLNLSNSIQEKLFSKSKY